MEFPKPQQLQSLDPRDYKVIACVAGTRHFNDRRLFHEKILEFLEIQEEPVLFLSGAAHSGADDLIIRWCAKFKYPCKRMPADWDNEKGLPNFNKRAAGFVRNAEMAAIATHLLAFFDGESRGTQDMIDRCEELHRHIQVILVPVQKPPSRYEKTQYPQKDSDQR